MVNNSLESKADSTVCNSRSQSPRQIGDVPHISIPVKLRTDREPSGPCRDCRDCFASPNARSLENKQRIFPFKLVMPGEMNCCCQGTEPTRPLDPLTSWTRNLSRDRRLRVSLGLDQPSRNGQAAHFASAFRSVETSPVVSFASSRREPDLGFRRAIDRYNFSGIRAVRR